MDQKGSPPQPESKTPEPQDPTKVRIEITFDMQTGALQMNSQAPTALVMAVLRRGAQALPQPVPETAEGAPRNVTIEYDLKQGDDGVAIVKSDAAGIITVGIIATAESMVTQNQVMQRITQAAIRSKLSGGAGAGVGLGAGRAS